MKHLRKIIPMLAVFLLLSCIGCSQLIDTMEDEELREYTEAMLDSIAANDFQAGYKLVDDVCSKEEFNEVFSTTRQIFTETDTYALDLLASSKNHSFDNGESTTVVQAAYLVTVDSARYVVSVSTHSAYEQLAGFHIINYEKTDYYQTGSLVSMGNANLLQWVVLLSNLIVIAVMIFAIVDACRHKIKHKPLWIAIILLGFVSIGVTLSASQFKFNFNLGWLFSHSALILGGGGTAIFRILLPIGSIMYFILRNQLIIKPAPEITEEQIMEEQTFRLSETEPEPSENDEA